MPTIALLVLLHLYLPAFAHPLVHPLAIAATALLLAVTLLLNPAAFLGRRGSALAASQRYDRGTCTLPTCGFVQRIADAVNPLRPAAAAITGDLVDGRVDALQVDVKPLVQMGSRYCAGYWGRHRCGFARRRSRDHLA